MEFIKTTDYFNLSVAELKDVKNEYGHTREDNLILNDGLIVKWYESLEGLRTGLDNLAIQMHEDNDYVIVKVILELVASKDSKYAIVLS